MICNLAKERITEISSTGQLVEEALAHVTDPAVCPYLKKIIEGTILTANSENMLGLPEITNLVSMVQFKE